MSHASTAMEDAVRWLTMVEELLHTRCEFEKEQSKKLGLKNGDVVLDICYEKVVAARDEIRSVLNGEYEVER